MENTSLNFAALIIPVALVFIGLEYLLAKKHGKKAFDFNRTVTSLSIGAAERLLNIFLQGSFYFLFRYIFDHFAVFHISTAWYNWVLLLFFTDFVWYWYHRLGHEVNILWAFHIVHHQSEDYNFSVAARVTNLQSLVRSSFWCVLPFIGFKPEMVAIMLVIHGSYSFFTHTEMIHKLGWLEKILITPSHHRVHHAANPEYLDKNYGDIFVFWDKIFGTFKEEDNKPVYGLTKPLKSYSFMWQHFHYLTEIIYRFIHTKGFVNKLLILTGKPDQMTGNEREIVERKIFPKRTRDKPLTNRYKNYVIVQLSAVLIIAFGIILWQNQFNVLHKTAGSVLILLTLINCGALLEQRKWIVMVEYLRALSLLFIIGIHVNNPTYYFIFILLTTASILCYSYIRQVYMKIVFDI